MDGLRQFGQRLRFSALCGAVPMPMPEQDRWVDIIRPVVQSSRGEQRKIFVRFQETTDFPVAEEHYA